MTGDEVRPLVVGVLAARTAARLAEQARSDSAARCDLLELRVDLLDPDVTLDAAVAAAGGRSLLVTCRPAREGGGFRGDERDRLRLLARAAALAPVRLVDVELSSIPPGAAPGLPAVAREGAVVSFHDFGGTPPDLEEIAGRAAETGAAHVKIVSTPLHHADAVRVLALNGRAGRARVSAFGMGEIGFPTRVLSAARGAGLVYAAVDAAAATAPGQPTVADLLDLYRIRSAGPGTRVFGVAGDPVAHSLSPRLHNALFARRGVDAVYLPFRAPDFRDLHSTRDEWRLDGLSVTIPHKVTAARLADRLDPVAERIGAVNTLVREPDGVHFSGHNTDAGGAVASLEESAGGEAALRRLLEGGARVVIAGAGGAARAILFGLVDRGAKAGGVFARDPGKAASLAAEVAFESGSLGDLAGSRPAILVQATAAGMAAKGRATGADETVIPGSLLSPEVIVFETVYTPIETRLVREARAAGARVVTGDAMFVRQAALQFRLFTGIEPALAEVRAAFERALA